MMHDDTSKPKPRSADHQGMTIHFHAPCQVKIIKGDSHDTHIHLNGVWDTEEEKPRQPESEAKMVSLEQVHRKFVATIQPHLLPRRQCVIPAQEFLESLIKAAAGRGERDAGLVDIF